MLLKRFYDFDWDERNEQHIAQHRVTVEEVEQCFFNHNFIRKKPKSRNRYYLYGQTDSGRYLFIVFDDLGYATARPVTAMNMDDREKAFYRRRRN